MSRESVCHVAFCWVDVFYSEVYYLYSVSPEYFGYPLVCTLSVFVLISLDRVVSILHQRSPNNYPKCLYLEIVSEFREELVVSAPCKSKASVHKSWTLVFLRDYVSYDGA
jgi:hypothetical protein